MSLHQTIQCLLSETEEKILRAIQYQEKVTWIPVQDEDGNPNIPSNERSVLVFLSGYQTVASPRPDDAGWGLRIGYFDHQKQAWRVHGSIENYVTHWRETPLDPSEEQST